MPTEDPMLDIMKAVGEGAAREGVDKIANVLGAPFPFWGMRKKAVDAYIKSIENGTYTPDEKYIMIAHAKKHCKELDNQLRIAEIAHTSAQRGTDFSGRSRVDDEFVARFMDSARFVSDEETQLLWGNVLAKEFEEPGSTPPSIIRMLSELPRSYADKFSNLCSLRLNILADTGQRITFDETAFFLGDDVNSTYLGELGINFSVLEELRQIGLIAFNTAVGYIIEYDCEKFPYIHLASGDVLMSIAQYPNYKLPIGSARLTEAGKCIARFIPQRINILHIEAVKAYLQANGVAVLETPKLIVTGVTETKTGREYSYQRI